MPYYFSRSSVKFQGHTGQKKRRFPPEFDVSGLQLQFELTYGYEMMHKAWSSGEELPYCFQGHQSNFKVTRAKNRQF